MKALVGTRVGRWFLLVVAALGIVVVTNPSFLPIGSGQPTPARDHRPPTAARDGDIITLTVTWAASKRPDVIGWAIGNAEQYVNMSLVPDVPPKFSQSLAYDHTKRYEIWAQGSRPLYCVIAIDGAAMDHDSHVAPPPPRQAAGSVDGDVHCWVEPI